MISGEVKDGAWPACTGKPDLAGRGTQALLSPTLTVVRYHATFSVQKRDQN